MMIQEVSFRQAVVTFTTRSGSAAAAPASRCEDSVSLSPEATEGTKAEKFVAALDADKDGAISDKEFIDGGTALLRPASHRRHPHDQSDNGVHRGWYGSHRLERIFDKVDANGDGTLDVDELTAALSAAAPPAPKPEETATEPPAEAPIEGQSPAAATFQFTFVSIAVRQYQVSGQEQTAAPPPPQLQAVA